MRKTAKANFTPKRQLTQYTCMAASLSMALEACGITASESTVQNVMGAAPMRGASWEQLIGAAQHLGARTSMVCPSTLEQVKNWTDKGHAVVIAWNPENREWSHASVIQDVSDDLTTVWIADPNIPDPTQTIREISAEEFYKKWFERTDSYLIRRTAVCVSKEVDEEGRQVPTPKVASTSFVYKFGGGAARKTAARAQELYDFGQNLLYKATTVLRPMDYGVGGKFVSISSDIDVSDQQRSFLNIWVVVSKRKRVDNYPTGWDWWNKNYASPLIKKVSGPLNKLFGVGKYDVEIDEKGVISISVNLSKLIEKTASNHVFIDIDTKKTKKTASNVPADVERYVEEIKKKNPGYDDSKVWATAWSVYCKHKNPGSDHCHQDSYFDKSATRIDNFIMVASRGKLAKEALALKMAMLG